MINNTCFIEVNTILGQMNQTDISKIPNDVLETINQKANNQLTEIDINKKIEEQISKEALSILTYIVLKYVANNEQKHQLKNSFTQNQIQYEQKQLPVKDRDNIFKVKEQRNELIVKEKESFIRKIINFFRRKA